MKSFPWVEFECINEPRDLTDGKAATTSQGGKDVTYEQLHKDQG